VHYALGARTLRADMAHSESLATTT
jgi:hypothetical protein